VPSKYITKNKTFPRIHLQEAEAVMNTINNSLSWAAGAIGVIVCSDTQKSENQR